VVLAVAAVVSATLPVREEGIPAATGSAGPSGSTAAGPPGQPSVPGVSPADARRITRGCADAMPDDPTAPLFRDALRTYNVVRDGAGTVALIYGPNAVVTCDVDGSPRPYDPIYAVGVGLMGLPDWLPGPVSVDARWGSESARNSGGPRYDLVAGRSARGVRTVAVTYGTASMTVPTVNGTYLARFVLAPGAASLEAGELTVRAYDARGALVAEFDPTKCWVTPNGVRLGGDRTGERCAPAVRWP
jgi:hypothetical protein